MHKFVGQLFFSTPTPNSPYRASVNRSATMVACSPKRTLALIVLLVLCDGLVASSLYGGSFVSLVEVVNHTKFTQDETKDLYVNLTVGMFGQGLNENIQIRPTSRVALRGSECFKNHPMKNIDSDNHIFKQVSLLQVTFIVTRQLVGMKWLNIIPNWYSIAEYYILYKIFTILILDLKMFNVYSIYFFKLRLLFTYLACLNYCIYWFISLVN